MQRFDAWSDRILLRKALKLFILWLWLMLFSFMPLVGVVPSLCVAQGQTIIVTRRQRSSDKTFHHSLYLPFSVPLTLVRSVFLFLTRVRFYLSNWIEKNVLGRWENSDGFSQRNTRHSHTYLAWYDFKRLQKTHASKHILYYLLAIVYAFACMYVFGKTMGSFFAFVIFPFRKVKF